MTNHWIRQIFVKRKNMSSGNERNIKGRLQDFDRGMKERAYAIAKAMKQDGMPEDKILHYCAISKEELDKL
jgi:hypothetical protein